MSDLFSFDDENFVKRFNDSVVVDSHDPADVLEFEAKPWVESEISNGLKVPDSTIHPRRRKSSVYRRLSVRTASISSYNLELVIPSDFNKIVEDHKTYKEDAISESASDSSLSSSSEGSSYKRLLKDFVPVKVLGQGAYGKVHLVQDKRTKKLFAQKQLRKPVINIVEGTTPETSNPHTNHVKRTIYERQILSNINHHPNIVKLFYALQDDNKFYLILEYIAGGELFHHLTNNNSMGNVFKEDHVAFYSAQMASGLRHLHKLGIVYRDLKPENCLLDNKGNLVLTDFGLSKDISENEEGCRSIIGTPEYMAPEILKGEEYGFPVDWWSLGCVIYDMMSGKPPFTGNSHKAIQDKILTKKLSLPFYFSMDAKDLLNKLLNKTPGKRLKVDEEWSKFLNHRFFRKLDWKLLESQDDSIVPPIVPVITDPILAENFSPEFTNLKISDYNVDQGMCIPGSNTKGPEAYDKFEGFSYTASSSFMDRFG